MDTKIIYKSKTKTGKEIIFRYPTIDDVEILKDFINKISAEKTYVLFQGEQQTSEEEKQWLESTIKGINNKEQVYIMAFVDNKLAGSASIILNNLVRKHTGTFGIVIDDNFRGDGIGQSLMETVIQESIKSIKDLKIITLEVFGDNLVAQNLYKKMGFIEYGRLPSGIKHKDNFVDAILMYKLVK